MITTKKLIFRTFKLVAIFYVLVCTLLYFFQEKLIFLPEKLDKNHQFSFDQPFEEINIKRNKGDLINALLFKSDSAKGLVFYLHGNAGSLDSWGQVAKHYTRLQYDFFILDYPGYGKSKGRIKSQEKLFEDVQAAYDEMKKRYREEHIVILGYSIGTAPAAKLASTNHPGILVLQAPFYNLKEMMRYHYPLIPTFLLKYKFETNEYLKGCNMPVVLFHGDLDEVVPYKSSLRLKKEMKRIDTLITISGQGHNGMTEHPEYISAIRSILK